MECASWSEHWSLVKLIQARARDRTPSANPDAFCLVLQAGSACTVLRIPYKLMLDFSVEGALLSVLNCCLNFRITQGWRRVEWQKTAECIEMLDRSLPELQVISQPCVSHHHLSDLCVYMSSVPPSECV